MTSLQYVPVEEIRRIRTAMADPFERSQVLADLFRLNTLYMIMIAGSGHIGSSFSSMDLFTWLWSEVMTSPNESSAPNHDIFFSSKGHDAPGLYSVLIGLGKLPEAKLHQLRQLDGLPGHPDVHTPFIAANTGSLGMGISKARGMALAKRLSGESGTIYVLTGDGELQEGQFWESLQPTVNQKYGNIVVIVDHNKFQSDTWVKQVSDLGDLAGKLEAFGWDVARCNGHDLRAVAQCLEGFKKTTDKPHILIADTIKGAGVSFMEHTTLGDDSELRMYNYHSGAPSVEDYAKASQELVARINNTLKAHQLSSLSLLSVDKAPNSPPTSVQKLVVAYGEELKALGQQNAKIVVLDGDLMKDCGLMPFKDAFPDRFVECGIAEQDMTSMAGGLALSGYLPIVHSFACFLTTRPNEQIYNNATEGTKVIYAGSLAGLIPSGPGHSHQSVRDISALGSIPGLTMIEPCDEAETRLALQWAVNENLKSTYIRLTSVPLEIPYTLPSGYRLEKGHGVELRSGRDAAIIGYGPTLLSEAYRAAEVLEQEFGLSVAVINLPWLNTISSQWLEQLVRKYSVIITLDNHYTTLGQGTLLAANIAQLGASSSVRLLSLGLDEIPVCGLNHQVLAHHQLNAQAIVSKVNAFITSTPALAHSAGS